MKRMSMRDFSLCVALVFALGACAGKKTDVETLRTPEEWAASYQVYEYVPNEEITGEYDESLAAKCSNGTFVGYMQDDVRTWEGIPYATQPIGDLRFKATVPAEPSDKVYQAYHFSKGCMQRTDITEYASLSKQGEDCLTLNVWNNVTDGSKNKPVIVFIHGGAWVSGGSNDPMYNGYYYAKHNSEAILVTINYRVNIMGILDLSDFPDGEDYPTNRGVLDQIEALKWIKENIAAFGGDPGNITIAGESAGANAVANLCINPVANKLISKAWIMSGGVNQGSTKEMSKEIAHQLKEYFHCETASDLSNIPFDELRAYWEDNWHGGTVLVRGDGIYPEDPFAGWKNGDTAGITVMNSYMRDDYNYYWYCFNNGREFFEKYSKVSYEHIMAKSSQKANELLEKYRGILLAAGCAEDKIPEIFMSDYIFLATCRYQARGHAANGGKGYFMVVEEEYDHPDYLKAAHALDCFLFFGALDGDKYVGTKEEMENVWEYQKMLTAFAKTGDPSTDKISWPEFTEADPKVLYFGPDKRVGLDYNGERLDVFMQMMDESDFIRYVASDTEYYEQVYVEYPELQEDDSQP